MIARNEQLNICELFQNEIQSGFANSIDKLGFHDQSLVEGFEVIYCGKSCFFNIKLT
jgi:hypothetical protein